MKALRRARRPDDFVEASEINVTPFIDVVLVLLIIFMIAAPLATVNVPVDLPSSRALAAPPPKEPITVTVNADLSVHVGERPVAREALIQALRAAGARPDTRLFLRADRGLPYGELMGVIEVLRLADYTKVALVGLETAP